MHTFRIDSDSDGYSKAERRFLRELEDEARQDRIDRQRKANAESASIEAADELHRLYKLLEEERNARISSEKETMQQRIVDKRRFIINLCVTIISAIAAVIAAVAAVVTLF